MEKIASFNVDHTKLQPGVYISRVDGDITTYDLRTRRPNTEDIMDNSIMHSVEHLFATFARNSKIKNDIIYFGPMGCQTGFYLLVRNANDATVIDVVKNILKNIIKYDGIMPGNSEVECGNYKNLDIKCAKEECKRYYKLIENITTKNLVYNT